MCVNIKVPVNTAAIELNQDSKITGGYEKGKLVITIDTGKQNIHQRLGLGTKTKLYRGDKNIYEAQELSCFLWPIRYRVITRQGYYYNEQGEISHFTTKAYGIDSKRHVSEVLMRASMFLLVMAGMGYRRVAWLLNALFHVETSKSSLHRWTEEIADRLPDCEEMIKLPNQKMMITEGHPDELYPLGVNHCILVLKDEHGRILATQPTEKKDEENTILFLQKIKDTGIQVKTFYTDGCVAYYNAIRSVFGDEVSIQYDYFHIIQNIWRHLRKWTLDYRRDVKKRSESDEIKTPWYKNKLKALAKSLWDNRYLIFKSEAKMTEEEKKRLDDIVNADQKIGMLRSFLTGVWDIFENSEDEEEAKLALEKLKAMETDKKNPGPFEKSIDFLEKNFSWMTAFLRKDDVKRNSLAETGMRVLRRLEFAHDGFRSDEGRENFLRIYQAIKYLDWDVYKPPPTLMNT